ncbi:hypothetical protein C4X99_05095 [Leptospira interrogans serovar Geyaweera]|nr:hypothetical protein C4X99_04825 [Leptospira interrogans serovar Geyaweera]KAA1292652.1 hypothetical protein C4X99_05095 [Leptospira interrogans serovar Geyaweera]
MRTAEFSLNAHNRNNYFPIFRYEKMFVLKHDAHTKSRMFELMDFHGFMISVYSVVFRCLCKVHGLGLYEMEKFNANGLE